MMATVLKYGKNNEGCYSGGAHFQWASNTSCGGVEVGEFQFLVGIGDVTTHRT